MPQRMARNAPTQGASRKPAWNWLVARRGNQMLRTTLVLFAFASTASGTASAQTVRQVLRDFGLLGTWQTDCSKPAASNNFRTVYEGLSKGDVRRTYYDAPGKIYSQYVLKRVSRISANQILYEQEGQNDLQFVVLTKIDNRYRVFSNHSRAGKVYVQEGKYVKDSPGTHGTDTPWQTKCYD
jgi:hypothetical protein